MAWIAYAGVSQIRNLLYTDLLHVAGGGYHGADGLTSTPNLMASHLGPPLDRAAAPPSLQRDTVDLLKQDQARRPRGARPPARSGAFRPSPVGPRRLPPSARGMQDTADLVQDAVFATHAPARRVRSAPSGRAAGLPPPGGDEPHSRSRSAAPAARSRPTFPDQLADPSAVAAGTGDRRENVARYERALQRLTPEDREAIIGRLEMQDSYDELALVLDKPSAAAARVTVTRAMKRLA